MFGDIFGFTLDDILHLKVNDKKQNLYTLLAQSEDAKAQAFLATLRELSFSAKIYSPDKLIDLIVNKTGYYTSLAFSEDGTQKRENIRRFISFAKKYVTGYQADLADFIRYIDLTIETGKNQGENTRQPANTVAVMTMHTSKGLEFPICFVSGLGTAFNKLDRNRRLMIDPILGMATYANESFGYNRSTAGIQAIGKKILAENANDEMRLLYVAMTRAKNKMFLTAQYTQTFTANTMEKVWEKTDSILSEYALRNATNPMEWILSGYANHPKLFGHKNVASTAQQNAGLALSGVDAEDMEKTTVFDADSVLDIHFVYPEEEAEVISKTAEKAEIAFDTDRAKATMDYLYPDLAKTRLPIKVSVGRIAKSNQTVTLRKPEFIKQQHFSAAEKGTQMHLFAQHCNILSARSDLDGEIARLDARGTVDRKLLNRRQIEAFLNSPVADIMVNAEKIYKEREFLVAANARKVLEDDAMEGQEILIQGVIDCLAINGGDAVVIDYKTDRVENMAQLYERYSKQLEMYRFAAESLYETTSVKCIIYSFYLGEYMEF